MASKFGFLVRTKDEEKWVGYCLQSIHDHFPDAEVAIVDNDSNDDTLSIARMFQPKIISIPRREYTPGISLNYGFDALDSEYICCISAHCEIDSISDLLEAHLGDQDCFGVIGRQRPIYKGKRIKPVNSWQNFARDSYIKNLQENRHTEDPFFHNAFSFIPKRMWEEENFCETVSGKEDRRWAKVMKDKGYFSIYDPHTVCDHHWTAGCATWKGMG